MPAFETEADQEAFLAAPRLGILMTNRADGPPLGVPVWFDWTGEVVEMFAGRESPKIDRLRRDPRASLLVTNRVGEPEAWVAFDGTVSIDESSGIELAERLAARYWDLDDPERRAALAGWQRSPESFCLLTLTPARVRAGQ